MKYKDKNVFAWEGVRRVRIEQFNLYWVSYQEEKLLKVKCTVVALILARCRTGFQDF